MPYLDPFPEDNPSNFKIVKPGYIEEEMEKWVHERGFDDL